MGSIGYIGGNITYMGGGMEYNYEGNSNPYQLWKPPSGYFPRGEAPPPYEEAVALAQAEALSTQCTVSVATTTHRTMPVGLNPNESILSDSQPNITTSTTNLINININNGGNITTLATGENHQNPYSLSSANYSAVNQPRSTQTHSNCSSSSSSSIGEPSNIVPIRNNTHAQSYQQHQSQANSICVQSTTSMPSIQAQNQCNNSSTFPQICNSQTANAIITPQNYTYQIPSNNQPTEIVECTYKNCTLNTKLTSSGRQHRSSPGNCGSTSSQQCSINCNSNGNQECSMMNFDNRNSSTAAILPPPLFDENEIQPEIACVEMIKTPSSMRRYHRTIPRHFTTGNSDSVAAHKDSKEVAGGNSRTLQTPAVSNKKPTCQCPVQHVPMSYMGSSHFNSQHHHQSSIFLSSLSTKLVSNNIASNNSKPSQPASSKNGSHPTGGSKTHTSSKQSADISTSFLKTEHSSSGTLKRPSHHSSGNYPHQNGNKIATISRHVVEQRHHDSAHSQQSINGQVHSILKTVATKERSQSNYHTNIIKSSAGNEVFNPPFPIQFIDGMSKSTTTETHSQHPALPPKMYKNQNHSHINQSGNVKQANPMFVSKIHTISKTNEVQQPIPPRTTSVSRSNGTYSQQLNILSTPPQHYISSSTFTKSLPRKDDKIHTLTLPPPAGTLNVEKSQSMGKINTTTYYPLQNGHATYTLPKSSNGKVSLNSTIASVVSKVPSVISIPSPSMSLQTIENTIQANQQTATAVCSVMSPSTKISSTTAHYDAHYKPTALNQILSNNPPTDKSKSTTLPKSKVSTSTSLTAIMATLPTKSEEKALPVCTTSKNCMNPKEHFLPNDTSLDDDYLSECENCKTAHSSRYYLEEEIEEAPQETMTLQRKMDDKEDEPAYYRTSLTLPTNTKKTTTMKNNREQWFSSIPASSSSDEEANE